MLAVRRDARGDPARDEQLALAGFRLGYMTILGYGGAFLIYQLGSGDA